VLDRAAEVWSRHIATAAAPKASGLRSVGSTAGQDTVRFKSCTAGAYEPGTPILEVRSNMIAMPAVEALSRRSLRRVSSCVASTSSIEEESWKPCCRSEISGSMDRDIVSSIERGDISMAAKVVTKYGLG